MIIRFLVYVDDVLFTENDHIEILKPEAHLHKAFTIKDSEKHHCCLGIEVNHEPGGMHLTQSKFTSALFMACAINQFKKVVKPLPMHPSYICTAHRR